MMGRSEKLTAIGRRLRVLSECIGWHGDDECPASTEFIDAVVKEVARLGQEGDALMKEIAEHGDGEIGS